MFDLVIVYLKDIIQVLIPCIFLRMVLDASRNYIFKN